MKRFTILLALSVMIAVPAMAERVTPEIARKVATTFLNNNGTKSNQLVDLSKAAGFKNLYIFSTESSFVVMSADDCVKPILGYSLTDKFDVDDMPENLRWWLQGYNDEIQWVIDNDVPSDTSNSAEWYDLKEGKNSKDTPVVIVAPLTETKWAQSSPYNMYCPTGTVTGCVATAMAQVMKKWNYPAHGIGSHDYLYSNYGTLSADFGSTQYNWNAMQNSYSNDNSNEEKEAVATLMYHCGVSVEMKYGPESGSNIKRASVSLRTYFNYNATYYEKKNFNNDDWIAMLKENLNDSVPVLYGGNSGNEGHAFVCDGYDNRDYFHFNWGWGGSPDAYYSINGHLYPNNQSAVFNIVPSICSASIPENLTCTLQSGYQVALSWDGANDAISYNIYRNNALLANTTDCSYTDTHAEIGINRYYVRSVDSENHLSLSSNCVSLTINQQDPIAENLSVSFSENDALLSWDAPIWYPQTNSGMLSYVDESRPDLDQFIGWNTSYCYYWGVRHLANDIQTFQGKAIYMVKIYTAFPASFQVLIYQDTDEEDGPRPVELLATQSLTAARTGWVEIKLDEPVIIDGSKDLWIFVYNPDSKAEYTPCKDVNYQGYGNYYSYDLASDRHLPHNRCYSLPYDIEWLICTYLTDDTYTYQLECNNTQIAQSISSTSYEDEGLANNSIYQYTVKTNHYGGVSAASNIAGLALGTTSLASLDLGASDKMTITENSKLTVSGILTSTNPNNLILENGAQLIHSNGNVAATVKKDIAPYTANDNGWYFIAPPVTETIEPSAVSGLLTTNTYDLYKFDQSQTNEWRNYKASSFSTLDHQTGYLYANSSNTTLTFEGTLAASTEATSLDYDEDAAYPGFNLIGNPYPCNTTIDRDFYIINGRTITLAETGTEIAPCEGVFVKATGDNESVTFTKVTSAKSAISSNCIDLVVTNNSKNGTSAGSATIDRARVRFGEGIGMEKLSLSQDNTQISLWQNGQDFAVAYANGANEMPISFMASQDGTYTISIEYQSLEQNYLHLIDNLTGIDIDLLATPNYTFEAKTSDYPSRFRLVFSICEDAVDDNAAFAYVNNGNIVVNQEGILQIVDMTGHVFYQRDAKHCVSTSGMVSGVYVLRLITADGVKTQKIVIE